MSVVTVYLIFQFENTFPKMFIYLGLVINVSSGQQLLRSLYAITGTHMYNQLLKIINERPDQRKMIEKKNP